MADGVAQWMEGDLPVFNHELDSPVDILLLFVQKLLDPKVSKLSLLFPDQFN